MCPSPEQLRENQIRREAYELGVRDAHLNLPPKPRHVSGLAILGYALAILTLWAPVLVLASAVVAFILARQPYRGRHAVAIIVLSVMFGLLGMAAGTYA